MTKWNPISRSPKENGEYLVCYASKKDRSRKYVSVSTWVGIWERNEYPMIEISHWAKLPKVPK